MLSCSRLKLQQVSLILCIMALVWLRILILTCRGRVIIINAAKVVYTGDQEEKKYYYHHSMFPGGLKKKSIGLMKREHPVELVEKAVHGMLPHNKLGDKMRKHLYVYEGAEHPHAAQKPMELK